jgi:hypothetical protein
MYKEYQVKITLPKSISKIIDEYAEAYQNYNCDADYQTAIDNIFGVSLLEYLVQIKTQTAALNNQEDATNEEKAELLKALMDAYALLELSATSDCRKSNYARKREWMMKNYNTISGKNDTE